VSACRNSTTTTSAGCLKRINRRTAAKCADPAWAHTLGCKRHHHVTSSHPGFAWLTARHATSAWHAAWPLQRQVYAARQPRGKSKCVATSGAAAPQKQRPCVCSCGRRPTKRRHRTNPEYFGALASPPCAYFPGGLRPPFLSTKRGPFIHSPKTPCCWGPNPNFPPLSSPRTQVPHAATPCWPACSQDCALWHAGQPASAQCFSSSATEARRRLVRGVICLAGAGDTRRVSAVPRGNCTPNKCLHPGRPRGGSSWRAPAARVPPLRRLARCRNQGP